MALCKYKTQHELFTGIFEALKNDKWPFQRGNNIKKMSRNYTLSLTVSLYFIISNGLVTLRIRN